MQVSNTDSFNLNETVKETEKLVLIIKKLKKIIITSNKKKSIYFKIFIINAQNIIFINSQLIISIKKNLWFLLLLLKILQLIKQTHTHRRKKNSKF